MTKPVIGITAFSAYHPSINDYCGLSYDYIKAVQQSGAIPYIISPWEHDISVLMNSIDGLILTGGDDINPKLYDQHAHKEVNKVDDQRDSLELSLLDHAYKIGLPTLGICRGCQLMNVFFGGSLIQHLPDRDSTIDHRVAPKLTQSHEVSILPNTMLASIYNKDTISAVSWHHQAIDQLGENIKIAAVAEDDVIEAIEISDTAGWMLGVQYHPESCLDKFTDNRNIFLALIAAIDN